MITIKQLIRRVLNKFGVEVGHYVRQRYRIMKFHDISLVLDIGANTGQYAEMLRREGYMGKIYSFEPIKSAFEQLSQKVGADPLWQCQNVALGDTDGTAEINISKNIVSSSILPITSLSTTAAPDSGYIAKETISISRLDSIYPEIVKESEQVYMKIDVQGFEMQVLKGALNSLPKVKVVEIEISIAQLYKDQPSLFAILTHFQSFNFSLAAIDKEWIDYSTGHDLQFNAFFINNRNT